MGHTGHARRRLRIWIMILGLGVALPVPALDWHYQPERDDPGFWTPRTATQDRPYPNGLPGPGDPAFRESRGVTINLFRFSVRATRQDAFEEERTAVQLAGATMDRELARGSATPIHDQVPGQFQDAFSEMPITLDFGILIRF